jgi:hypothetical protein
LPPGKYEIVFRYEPASLTGGLRLAGFGIAITVGGNRLPRWWAILILVFFGAYLGIYSAMLAAGFVLI